MEGSGTATSAAAAEDSSPQRAANPFATPGAESTDNPFATPVVATPAAEYVASRQLGQTRNNSSFDGMFLSIAVFLLLFFFLFP
jgi:hypothetical protein